MLGLAGRPSLHSYDACAVYWVKRALQRNCGLNIRKTPVSLFGFFLVSRYSSKHFWGLVLWHLWIVRSRNPGPGVGHLAFECRWLAYTW